MSVPTILLASLFAGTVYFQMMERTIETRDNCSYLASPWTDHLAFVAGAVLVARGVLSRDTIVVFIGALVATEHAWQYAYHKGGAPLLPIPYETLSMLTVALSLYLAQQ